jgi:HK97 family phage prohead protease
MTIKHVIGRVRQVAPETADHDIEVVCSDESVDRSGEVIHQDGWDLAPFRANPVFLAAHQHRLADGSSPVIGSFKSIDVESADEARRLIGRVRFADTDLGREYRSLYRDGHMRAVSVGFECNRAEQREDTVDGRRVKRSHLLANELYEVSAVAVGANRNALLRLRELGWDDGLGDAAMAEVLKGIRDDNERAATKLKA